MADLGVILGDLDAETRTIDDVVANLPAADWGRATPAEGWTIAHQIAHLAWTDRLALLSATDEDAFAVEAEQAAKDLTGYVTSGAEELASEEPAKLLTRWRDGYIE